VRDESWGASTVSTGEVPLSTLAAIPSTSFLNGAGNGIGHVAASRIMLDLSKSHDTLISIIAQEKMMGTQLGIKTE
jgi:hypothetical protein